MSRATLAVLAVAVGALIAFIGQEFHLWRQHRRRFDEARRIAYTGLITQSFRVHNAFAFTWSPASFYYGRKTYLTLLDDVMAAAAAARLVASKPVQQASIELFDAVEELVTFATSILARDARFGFIAWYLLGLKPMPVAKEPGFQDRVDRLGAATTLFVVAAQKEMKVPPRRKRQTAD